jgi:hypothetical protein
MVEVRATIAKCLSGLDDACVRCCSSDWKENERYIEPKQNCVCLPSGIRFSCVASGKNRPSSGFYTVEQSAGGRIFRLQVVGVSGIRVYLVTVLAEIFVHATLV